MKFFSIGLFGVVGVFSRYFLGLWVSKHLSSVFPYGTFLINLLGAFAIGIIYVLGVERSVIPPEIRMGIMVGFLGGFTTFSSYCLEGVRLAEESEFINTALYMVGSPILGFIATLSGMFFTRKFF